jgi:uncharacterized protein YndB with AHSA1/START domain
MLGIVKETAGGYELRFERHLQHPVEKVWAALTEPERLVGWLAEAEVDLALGGRIQLRWLNTDEQGNTAVARGTITEIDPPRLLAYDTDIHGRLRWELRPEGDGCLLTFTVTLPGPNPYLTRILAGWHIHLDHLAAALDGEQVDWPRWMADHYPRWKEHHDRYVASLADQR